jgi:hypothetical protein
LPEGVTVNEMKAFLTDFSGGTHSMVTFRTEGSIRFTEGRSAQKGTYKIETSIPINGKRITLTSDYYTKTYFAFNKGDKIFFGIGFEQLTSGIPDNGKIATLNIGDLDIQSRYIELRKTYSSTAYICYVDSDGSIYNRSGKTIPSGNWYCISDQFIYIVN